MASKRLTQRVVDNLSPTEKLTVHFDSSLAGFGVYTKGKAKTYFVQARVGGKPIKFTIGKATVLSLDEARREAKSKLGMIAKGVNPVAEKRREEKQNITLQEILGEYLEANRDLKDSSKNFYTLCVDSYLKEWKNKPINKITDDDVKKKHSTLSKKIVKPKAEKSEDSPTPDASGQKVRKKRTLSNGPGIADGVMKTLRALLNYAIDEYPEVISSNPVTKLKKKWNRPKPRENYLRQDQLPAWHKAVFHPATNPTVRDVLLLMLYTGLRSKSEAFPLSWSNVDFTARNMHFVDTKNRKTLVLPMNNQVHNLLKRRSEQNPTSTFVFPSDVKDVHIADIRKELNKINERAGISLDPHDLRRTFSTYGETLDISPYTLKSLLNHSMGKKRDVTAGYIQISTDRMRKASQMIADYIDEILINAVENDRGRSEQVLL
ncbi:integrase family protein [Trichlorobacter lovleyi]|uniref:tyrosine-type recombinase/integrase n=1 Tax=Trichlorobacter lovleyi TaxID=313985 RepID=UPI002480C2EE|nr:integrase family protein [Trichlorobacter lovleyi]